MKNDPPLLLMNLGAVLSLSGFMMSDILLLRLLSMSGSICGMIYNFVSAFALHTDHNIVTLLVNTADENTAAEGGCGVGVSFFLG